MTPQQRANNAIRRLGGIERAERIAELIEEVRAAWLRSDDPASEVARFIVGYADEAAAILTNGVRQ